MNDRLNEFALAMVRLERLFARADGLGRYPHELDAATFYTGWSLLNQQPFEVRQKQYERLLKRLQNPALRIYRGENDAKPRSK